MADGDGTRTVDVEAALQLGYELGKSAGRRAGWMLGLPGPAPASAARVGRSAGGRPAGSGAGGKRDRAARAPLAAVISARNEERTIAAVVRSAAATAGVARVVVVVNGCQDDTAAEARRAGAEVIEYLEPVGHDVGRAIGVATLPGYDIILLDGDFALPPAQLRSFVTALRRGADIVLNDQNPVYATKPRVGTVTLVRLLLNRLLGRPDLGVNSLLIVPAGLSARAVRRLGPAVLAVPPLAQAKAVLAGLRICVAPGVDVLTHNRRRPGLNAGADLTPLEMLIIGDHLEAIGYLLKQRGPRGGYTDLGRSRELLTQMIDARKSIDSE